MLSALVKEGSLRVLETSDFLFDALLVLEFLDALFFDFAITISFLNLITNYRLMPQAVSGLNILDMPLELV